MYYQKIASIFLFFLLAPLSLVATTYEDATNKKTDGWHVLEQFSKGVVKNIYDKKKKSRVIALEGNGTRTVYMFTPKKKSFKREKEEHILEWEMNYREDFVIMIGINTLKGKRFLIYTSGENNSYLQYGLGLDSCSGKWKRFHRDLQRDLEASDSYNEFLNITHFVIKGSGRVDNIKMVKLKKPTVEKKRASKAVTPPLASKKEVVKGETTVATESKKNSTPPTIHLKGKNPMIIKKGEPYIEPGAVAKNRDGSTVMVTISDDIDILKEGEYSVIYMATNSAGHSVIDRRRVIVGKVTQEKKSKEQEESKKSEEAEELEDEAIDLEQRALEMLEWEKELALREKALMEEKNRKEATPSNLNYPSRPGL